METAQTAAIRTTTAEPLERIMSFGITGRNANLPAVTGPPRAGGLTLSRHADTVPIDGQACTGERFKHGIRPQSTRPLHMAPCRPIAGLS